MKLILSLLMLGLPLVVSAESTINCHCFQSRTFNHRDSAAADPYFLATTQNSFISVIYNIDKRELVKAKMSGTSGSHLWILHDVAAHSQQPASQVETIHSASGSWAEVFKNLGLNTEDLGEKYWQLSSTPEYLADHIVDLKLIEYFTTTSADLHHWHNKGLNRKELILSLLLDGDPLNLYNQVNSGMKTWGQLLYEQGLRNGGEISQKLKNLKPSSAD
ncbi:MAG: hypothetical protein OQK50_08845 [Deltaproteobacteria bacterium]|nr:hypothetical protein [Deltaproteobacteria bacterium]MCW9050422.1 hypothetical protein [Deltaproteobacteria bacterium]